jgi:hypothetical protein
MVRELERRCSPRAPLPLLRRCEKITTALVTTSALSMMLQREDERRALVPVRTVY